MVTKTTSNCHLVLLSHMGLGLHKARGFRTERYLINEPTGPNTQAVTHRSSYCILNNIKPIFSSPPNLVCVPLHHSVLFNLLVVILDPVWLCSTSWEILMALCILRTWLKMKMHSRKSLTHAHRYNTLAHFHTKVIMWTLAHTHRHATLCSHSTRPSWHGQTDAVCRLILPSVSMDLPIFCPSSLTLKKKIHRWILSICL